MRIGTVVIVFAIPEVDIVYNHAKYVCAAVVEVEQAPAEHGFPTFTFSSYDYYSIGKTG